MREWKRWRGEGEGWESVLAKCQEMIAGCLARLSAGSAVLKRSMGVAVGFVDGDVEVVWDSAEATDVGAEAKEEDGEASEGDEDGEEGEIPGAEEPADGGDDGEDADGEPREGEVVLRAEGEVAEEGGGAEVGQADECWTPCEGGENDGGDGGLPGDALAFGEGGGHGFQVDDVGSLPEKSWWV